MSHTGAAGGAEMEQRRSVKPRDKPNHKEETSITRIMHVDASSVHRMVARRALVAAGYEVVSLADGHEALAHLYLENTIPDVMVLDVATDGLSGLEVISMVRKTWNQVKLPVILSSSRGDEASVLRALGANCNDFLLKPIQPDEFVARVQTQLRIAELFREDSHQQLLRSVFPAYVMDTDANLPEALSTPTAQASLTVMSVVLVDVPQLCAVAAPGAVVEFFRELCDNLASVAENSGVLLADAGVDGTFTFVSGHRPVEEGGAPDCCAAMLLDAALDVLEMISATPLPIEVGPDEPLHGASVRIGVHSGPAVTGVIGCRGAPRYGILGSTVQVARQIAMVAPLMGILLSGACHEQLLAEGEDDQNFIQIEERLLVGAADDAEHIDLWSVRTSEDDANDAGLADVDEGGEEEAAA